MPTNANPGKGRILALDLGKKRIGLALSDPLGLTAQGLPTLQRVNIRTDLAELDRLATEHDVRLILLGLPLHMSGDEGRQAAARPRIRRPAGRMDWPGSASVG